MPKSKSTRPPSKRAAGRDHIEEQRRRLNKASAVLIGAELTAEYCPEMSIVSDAISAARELVDATVAALDAINL